MQHLQTRDKIRLLRHLQVGEFPQRIEFHEFFKDEGGVRHHLYCHGTTLQRFVDQCGQEAKSHRGVFLETEILCENAIQVQLTYDHLVTTGEILWKVEKKKFVSILALIDFGMLPRTFYLIFYFGETKITQAPTNSMFPHILT